MGFTSDSRHFAQIAREGAAGCADHILLNAPAAHPETWRSSCRLHGRVGSRFGVAIARFGWPGVMTMRPLRAEGSALSQSRVSSHTHASGKRSRFITSLRDDPGVLPILASGRSRPACSRSTCVAFYADSNPSTRRPERRGT